MFTIPNAPSMRKARKDGAFGFSTIEVVYDLGVFARERRGAGFGAGSSIAVLAVLRNSLMAFPMEPASFGNRVLPKSRRIINKITISSGPPMPPLNSPNTFHAPAGCTRHSLVCWAELSSQVPGRAASPVSKRGFNLSACQG